MKVLITGAAGFMAPFLAKQCRDAGAEVLGIDYKDPEAGWWSEPFRRIDVRDEAGIRALIGELRPEKIFHLAAQSYPTVSMNQPVDTITSNICGTINVFEAVREAKLDAMIVVACSSAEYGEVAAENLPVKETHPLEPLHPYGVSKIGQDLLARQYFLNYGIRTVRIRIFNTTGPGKRGDICGDFTQRAVEIESGLKPAVLKTGNLSTRRAIIDVRDMTRGLWVASESGEPGEVYNVGAHSIYSGQEILDEIRTQLRASFEVKQAAGLMRKCDERVIAGDVSKFHTRTGWKAEIPLQQTIADMLAWWRLRLNREVENELVSKGADA